MWLKTVRLRNRSGFDVAVGLSGAAAGMTAALVVIGGGSAFGAQPQQYIAVTGYRLDGTALLADVPWPAPTVCPGRLRLSAAADTARIALSDVAVLPAGPALCPETAVANGVTTVRVELGDAPGDRIVVRHADGSPIPADSQQD